MKFQHKITALVIFLFTFSIALNAQEQLNDYKYIVVPEKFSCQKNANDYQLNGLTQFLLQKQNFIVFLESESLPEDAIKNGCLVVYADVTENSSMFKTKLNINFRNCNNQIVFTSEEGISSAKEYKVAYNVALRNTIKTFQNFKHNYKAQKVSQPAVLVMDDTPDTIVKPQEKTPNTSVKTAVATTDLKASKNDLFTAVLIPGSVFCYQLKTDNNTIAYTILFSGKEDVYVVKGTDAVIYKMNSQWVLAQYKNDTLEVKAINIQF